MTHVGFLLRVEWNHQYTEPPNGWPRLLAEMYVPKEDYNALHGKMPESIASFPRPLGCGYSLHVQAIHTPIKSRSKEMLMATRQKLLAKRMTRKYPLFAAAFAAQEVARKPAYYIEGIGACQTEREALLAREKAEFEQYTARPNQLVVYASPYSP
jgi:hypothetical protein